MIQMICFDERQRCKKNIKQNCKSEAGKRNRKSKNRKSYALV
jgi:hypothetical protein